MPTSRAATSFRLNSVRASCRCSSMAMPPSPARAWSPSASACRVCAATAPPARSTSSSTTRSASRRTRASRVPRPIPPTSPRWSRRRFSIATATIRKRSSMPPRSPRSSGRSSTSRSSSTCSATGATATTRATSRPSPSRRCTRPSVSIRRRWRSTARSWSKRGWSPPPRSMRARPHGAPSSRSSSRRARTTAPTRPTGWMACGRA